MRNGPLVALFAVLLLAAGIFIIGSSGALPERVASHFDASGFANGYMTRDGYRIFMLAFGVGLPLLMVALISGLPRLMPGMINIPNRAYWLAPERREKTFVILDAFALWLGCMVAATVCGVHWLVIRANSVRPPQLDNMLLLGLLGMLFAALALWIFLLLRRFRKTS